jgi:hypothetical protein
MTITSWKESIEQLDSRQDGNYKVGKSQLDSWAVGKSIGL